jgi:hypothetical protein
MKTISPEMDGKIRRLRYALLFIACNDKKVALR